LSILLVLIDGEYAIFTLSDYSMNACLNALASTLNQALDSTLTLESNTLKDNIFIVQNDDILSLRVLVDNLTSLY